MLSVNPEIQIDYNKEGKVIALAGQNEEGKGIVEAYPDYIGKNCDVVLRDLVEKINEAGYFVEDIDGNEKNIVFAVGTRLGTSKRPFPGGYERQHPGGGQRDQPFFRDCDH